MGTDIHLYVEKREGKRWETCDVWEKDKYEKSQRTVPYGKHFFSDRSYDTFAILADVRNGHGFAGIDTGDGFVPISAARGLPKDLSPELEKEASRCCDHTPSWLMLKELLEYDWTRTTKKRGWVSGVEFANWIQFDRDRGFGPKSWSGGVSGGQIEHISEQEMERKIEAIKDRTAWQEFASAIELALGKNYCLVSWEIPYYRAASQFLSETMPRLWRLGKPDEVRIVFWFDS